MTTLAIVGQNTKERVEGATDNLKNLVPSESSEKNASGKMNVISIDSAERSISKMVIRQKLNKLRHLVLKELISPNYLEECIFPTLLELFEPQEVMYNGGIANIKKWKISCYLEVMPGGVPTTSPHLGLLLLFTPLLDECDRLFSHWFVQQKAYNNPLFRKLGSRSIQVERQMTFVTRYRPTAGQNALLKHVDGAGKVDGSVVVALPTNKPFTGGGLTFWDGKRQSNKQQPQEIHYDTRAGDVAFIDRAVWHQADPITSGERYALVIFYKVDGVVSQKEVDSI